MSVIKGRAATCVVRLSFYLLSLFVGAVIGSWIFLSVMANAADYTAIGHNNKGETIVVEFYEVDKQGSLSGFMWNGLNKKRVSGIWFGKGMALFHGVEVRVVDGLCKQQSVIKKNKTK